MNIITDNVVITKRMNAAHLLKALDLDDAYDDAILKICESRNMVKDRAGYDFLYGKLEELDAYIAAHKIGTPTLEEVKPIIVEWIEKQAAEIIKPVGEGHLND